MLRPLIVACLLMACFSAKAAETVFDFSKAKLNLTPEGFRSTVTGSGNPGDWRVVLDQVASGFPAVPGKGPEYVEQSVLAQLSRERVDDRYPLLIFEKEKFGDFVPQTRFKLVAGQDERMAGIAFRIQDDNNYYYIRASGLGNTFTFFRFIKGALSSPVSSEVTFQTNVWYDLTIDCKANEVRAAINGTELLLVVVREAPIASGRVGFWTKSDSVSYFGSTRITYTPRLKLAEKLIEETMKKYPRLQGVKIFAGPDGGPDKALLIASTDKREIGIPAQTIEKDVINRSKIYYGKDNDLVLVTFPLHDANGDTVAAIKLVMKSFPGQTEKNALARALPIVKDVESKIQRVTDLVQ